MNANIGQYTPNKNSIMRMGQTKQFIFCVVWCVGVRFYFASINNHYTQPYTSCGCYEVMMNSSEQTYWKRWFDLTFLHKLVKVMNGLWVIFQPSVFMWLACIPQRSHSCGTGFLLTCSLKREKEKINDHVPLC